MENRSAKTPATPNTAGSGEWVLLHAGASHTTKEELETFRKDANNDPATSKEAAHLVETIYDLHGYGLLPRSQWVGFVRFSAVGSYKEASQPGFWGSKGTSGWWHNSQHENAWVIDAAIPMLPETKDSGKALAPRL